MGANEKLIDISDTMCRTCHKGEADKNLFDEHRPSSSEYVSILESCIAIKVSKDDGLPTRICGNCLKKLLSFHNFKISVIENEFKLRKSMKIRSSQVIGDELMHNNVSMISVNEKKLDYMIPESIKMVKSGISPEDLTFVTDSDSASENEILLVENNENRKSHSEEKLYSCDICIKKFSKAEHVLIHKRIHTGERPHKCLICKKRFIQFAALKSHIKSHTKKMSHICKICGKTFSQSSTLGTHLRVHTDERPFICQICGKTFRNNGNLITHVRFHQNDRPYGCDQCDRRFITSSHLNTHARQHSGERPFKCVVCSKTFGRSEHLKGHLVIHSGLKPYQCASCPRRYRQNSHLRRHVKAVHENEVGGDGVAAT